MKTKTLCMSLLGVMIFAGSAWPVVTVNGKDIDSISDILREARSGGIISEQDTNLEIEKASVLRIHDGQLDLTYNIGKGNKALSVGKIRDFSTGAAKTQDNGFLAALAKTKFGSTKVLITSSHTMSSYTSNSGAYNLNNTNWFYDLYFVAVSNDSKVTQSRFGAWRYPMSVGGTTSGYIKDIKTGISVNGYDGELVVAATMEATNDNPARSVKYSDKKVNARLDFWSLYQDASGNVQYKKLDNLTTKVSGYETAPLAGFQAVPDSDWASANNLNSTTASPYMLVKCAIGDFNDDGYANEVAMMTADVVGIHIDIYQITYSGGNFSIRRIDTGDMGKSWDVNGHTQYTYNYPDYFRKWSYNGYNRVPGADILAGDFDGNGTTDLAVVFQEDFSSGQRNYAQYGDSHWVSYNGATVMGIKTHYYKWNKSTSKFECSVYSGTGFWSATSTSETFLLYGGLKAVTADLDGDGKDEIVMAYFIDNVVASQNRNILHACLEVLKLASDGKIKETSHPFSTKLFDKKVSHVEEYMLAPGGTYSTFYPVADRELSLVAGPFFDDGTTTIKPKDGIAFRYYGSNMKFFKGSNGTLVEDSSTSAPGTSVLVASDFAGEGMELGKAIHFMQKQDVSYTAILQAPPYHVDSLTEDGTALTSTPTNFSYVNGAATVYERTSSSSNKETTKFNISETVETVFAIDSDFTRGLVKGVGTANSIYGAVKTVAGFIPGVKEATSKYTAVVDTVFGFLDKCKDKMTTIKEGFDAKVSTTKLQGEMKAERLDALYYVSSTRNIWRYPIITKPAPVWPVDYTSVDEYIAKQDYVTFALSNTPIPNSAVDDPLYQPIHENGNLFSYPKAVANTEGYSSMQRELTGAENARFSTTTNGKAVEFLESAEHEETTSKKVEKGYISQGLSLIDSLFGTDLAKVPESSTSPTYTRTEQKGEKITFALPNADSAPLNLGYTYQYQAYAGENGAVTTSFGVHSFNKGINIFSPQSLYSKKPDPSMTLPYKFTVSNSSGRLPTFRANPSRRQAMEMRGVRFYAVDYNRYTPGELLANETYRVEIPVYNASFMDARNVRVDLYYVKDRETASLSAKQFIGTAYVNMTGWEGNNNKAWAQFEWKPKAADGNYEIYAVIDPEKAMDEVHETRTNADPGGNNEGYFSVSIQNADTAAYVSSVRTSGFRAAIDTDEIIFPTMTYNGKEMWREFYDEYIASSDGPVSMTVTLTNNMDYTIPDTEIRLSYIDPELLDTDDPIGTADFVKKITLFPHETYTYEITIDADIADKLRRVGKDNTACGYTCFWLEDFLTAEQIEEILEGDADPELEVYDASGDVEPEMNADNPGSSGGGCDAGLGVIGMLALAVILMKRR